MFVIMPYYFGYLDQPMWEPIIWNLLFIVINAYWVVKILLERRPPRLTPDERKLYDFTFRSCTPRQMLQILALAEWKSAAHNELLVEAAHPLDRLMVIVNGTALLQSNGSTLALLSDGDFVGEMSYLSRKNPTARVVARGNVRFVSWKQSELKKLFDKRVDLQAALQGVIGLNLIEKLTTALQQAPQQAPDISAIFKSI
jgi:CRP-like cAMP-binding protein